MEPAATIGHNQPPSIAAELTNTPEEWTDRLSEVFEQAIERAALLMESYRRFELSFPLKPSAYGKPIGIEHWDDEVQGRAGDLRDKLLSLLKTAESVLALEKGPILTAQRAVDGYLRNFREPLDNALRTIRGRQTVYAKWQEAESRERAAREAAALQKAADEASQKALRTLESEALQHAADTASEAEAAAQHAAGTATEHTRVHGDSGSVTALRGTWAFIPEESDLMVLVKAVANGKAPLTFLEFNERRIKLAVRAEKLRAMPGLVIREEKEAR